MQARVERFVEPALLLLLRDGETHGYDLAESLAEMVPDERFDLGNLYRLLRSLEEDGLVRSRWRDDLPGRVKRTYELTDDGRAVLDGVGQVPRPAVQHPRRLRAALPGRRRMMRHSMHAHIHHHIHHHRGPGGRPGRPGRRGRRRYEDLDAVIAFLEERQRDLEQAAADVAAKIQRLQERRDARPGSPADDATAADATAAEASGTASEGVADPAAPTDES